jgi:aspartate/methionine/tyrosine aminotransferase
MGALPVTSELKDMNDTLKRMAPGCWKSLSRIGLNAILPKGIPVQAAAARTTEINATIGQVTDGCGVPLPLQCLKDTAPDLDPRLTFLYSPLSGNREVRAEWLKRQRRIAGNPKVKVGHPVMTHGLTHAISILATLFSDPETTIVIADPFWENYRLLFSLYAGAKVVTYPAFDGENYNVAGLEKVLQRQRGKKTVAILNLPGNPTGYTPKASTIPALVNVITNHPDPLVVIVDDAYQGTQYEEGLMNRSCFWDLAEAADPKRTTVFKVDGSTKELLFFSGRVGFITSNVVGEAEKALLSKILCIIRGTVGSAPGPSQAMILKALQDPTLDEQVAARQAVLARRYKTLKSYLSKADPKLVKPFPFNSAYFGVLGMPANVDADKVRQLLIEKYSVGTIYLPSINALRVAYCSIEGGKIERMVQSIENAIRELA